MGLMKDKKQHDPDPGTSQQFQTLYDQIVRGTSNIILIGTANTIQRLPKPIKDRFNGAIFGLPLPDLEKRKEAFRYHLPTSVSCSDALIERYARRTNGMSLRNVLEMCNNAVERAYQRTDPSTTITLTDDDLKYSLAFVRSCIKANETSLWKRFKKNQVVFFSTGGLLFASLGICLTGIGLYFTMKNFLQAAQLANKSTGVGLVGMASSVLSHREQILLGISLHNRSLQYQQVQTMMHNFIQLI